MLIKDIEKMEAYTPTEYVNDSEPDLDADNLNKTERQLRDTVAKANEIIDTLKSLISNVSVNSEDTVPSSAVAYKMEQDIEQLNSNIDNALYYKGMLPSDNANNADANGIYKFTPTTNFGTSGIVNQGYGVIICWGTGKISGQDGIWCWQRCYFTNSFTGAYRTRTNTDQWSPWIEI